MNTRLKTLSKGIIDVSPLMIPVFPFGIIYGVIGMDLGIGPYMTLALSIIIFGGASQIVLLQLFSGGASSLVTAFNASPADCVIWSTWRLSTSLSSSTSLKPLAT